MRPHLRLATRDRASDLDTLIETAHRLRDDIEQQSLELRLALMQTRARMAELKATLRAVRRYL